MTTSPLRTTSATPLHPPSQSVSQTRPLISPLALTLVFALAFASSKPANAKIVGPPTITSISDAALPQANAKLPVPPPTRLNIFGTSFSASMSVNFTGTAGTETVTATPISATSLIVSLPAAVFYESSVAVSVCNVTAGTSLCSASTTIPVFAPASATGTLVSLPTTGVALAPNLLTANFLPNAITGTNPAPGAPGGPVAFSANGATVGTANLVLDSTTAKFVAPANAQNYTNQYGALLVAGDINGDGLPDVIVGTQQSYIVNNGTFTFQALLILQVATTPYGNYNQVTSPFPDTQCNSGISQLGLGDFNGDGLADLIYICSNYDPNAGISSTNVGIAIGNGDGTFQSPIFRVPTTANIFTVGDFNQDGHLDFVTAAQPASSGTVGLALFAGNGAGGFAAPVSSLITSNALSTDYPQPPIATDMNADGYPDLVLFDSASTAIEVFQNNKLGNFGTPSTATTGLYSPTATVSMIGTNYNSTLLAGDFNGDGLPDLAVANASIGSSTGLGSINVALNTTSAGILSLGTPSTFAVPALITAAAADFNGDGRADFAIADGTNVYVMTANPNGTFSSNYGGLSVPASVPSSSGGQIYLLAQDINTDGYADLLIATNSSGSGSVSVADYITSGGANATLTTTLPTGTIPLAAAWLGNNNFSATAATTSTQILGLSTTTSATALPLASEFGQPITFNVSISEFFGNHFALQPVLGGSGTGLGSRPGTGSGGFHPESPLAPSPAIGGTVTLLDNGVQIAAIPVLAGVATASLKSLTAGPHSITAVYSGDQNYAGSSSPLPILISVGQAQPTVTWAPTTTTIPYGTPLTTAELNATAASTYFTAVPGTFAYTPAVGAILTAGPQTLTVRFAPTDTLDFKSATKTITINVTKVAPTIVWPTPAPVPAGTTLSATQLDATATGINGVALTGTFTYTPAAGAILTSGTKALSVAFAPTDAADYTTATGTQSLQIIGGNLTAIAPQTANIGDPAKLVTLTGVGFAQFSTVLLNGTPLPTTYVSATTLTATIPAAVLANVATLNLSVADQALGTVSNTLPFAVVAPTVTATLNGPSTSQPGQQPSLSFNLPAPYPVPLTGTLTLAFTPSNGNADDPAIQFATGGRTYTFTLPANATSTNAFQLQAGTVTGTITVTLTLTGGGTNVTPPTIQPIAIELQPAAPIITSTTITRSLTTLTVVVHGFSNTRQINSADFHFNAAPGASLSTTDLTVPVTAIFANWFSDPVSEQYGSIFTYTQAFTLDQDASTIGNITVTLTNSVGQSTPGSAQ